MMSIVLQWNGTFCDQPICSAQCNLRNGYCTTPGECHCNAGWTGASCNTGTLLLLFCLKHVMKHLDQLFARMDVTSPMGVSATLRYGSCVSLKTFIYCDYIGYMPMQGSVVVGGGQLHDSRLCNWVLDDERQLHGSWGMQLHGRVCAAALPFSYSPMFSWTAGMEHCARSRHAHPLAI